MTWQIRNWAKRYETPECRKIKGKLKWVATPNKHDGKSFSKLRKLENRVPVFCAWNLILQIASKMPERGILADEDGPLDIEDMENMTGFPREIFEQALNALSQGKIRWLEQIED
jgi:hypothetical protein